MRRRHLAAEAVVNLSGKYSLLKTLVLSAVHTGYVNAFKEVFTEAREKDFLFEIKFQGWENPNNEKHQIRTHELAQGLADAQALGVAHRVDFSKSHHVSFPIAGADDDVSMEEDAGADGTDDGTADAMEEEA